MRPFRSRVIAAVVMAILMLGLFGSVAEAHGVTTQYPAASPWNGAQIVNTGFPEDPWPDL